MMLDVPNLAVSKIGTQSPGGHSKKGPYFTFHTFIITYIPSVYLENIFLILWSSHQGI